MKKINHNVSKDSWMFLVILSMLMAITSLSIDVYLPAMPQMEKDLHGDVEFTVTGFLIGFAIGQLIWGSISDRIGRKIPLFLGVGLFVIGSIGCAMAQSITTEVIWRVIQSLGACAGPMLARAMIRDLYTKTRAAQMLSTLVIIMAIAPIAGPLIGGQIIAISNWHNIFWFLAIIGVLILFSVYFLPETLQPSARHSGSFMTVFYNYAELFKHLQFMRYTLCVTFYYIAAYAFIVGSPFVYISYYGISPQHFGWLFALNIIGLAIVSFFNRILVNKYEINTLLSIATKIASFTAVIMAILTFLNFWGIYMIIIAVFIIFSMNGIIAACATAGALDEAGHIAGSASALIGSLQYGSGIISSLLLAFFYDGTSSAMVYTITISLFLCAIVIMAHSRKDNK